MLAFDGVVIVVSSQSKMILAVIASAFGDFYPIVMIASVEVLVLSQLLMIGIGVVYSSLLSVNPTATCLP